MSIGIVPTVLWAITGVFTILEVITWIIIENFTSFVKATSFKDHLDFLRVVAVATTVVLEPEFQTPQESNDQEDVSTWFCQQVLLEYLGLLISQNDKRMV